jgi:N-acetylated-alpha-linked acidic dipeptidase
MAKAGDPGFLYHAAMARYAGVLALRYANADLYPFDAAAYGGEIARYAEDLAGDPKAASLKTDLAALAREARAWSDAARAAQAALDGRMRSGGLSPPDTSAANAWLLSLERALLDPQGLPGRPWFRHLIYAPLPSYAAETLPAIRERVAAGDLPGARAGIDNLSRRLAAAADSARTMSGPGSRP